MKRVLIMVAIAATILVPMGIAMATPPVDGPPGQGECQHGNSGQDCKPDPQPDHGQDCEEHGPNEGGVNEDHCLDTTTTSTVSSSPTTTVTVTTSTVSTTPPETTSTTSPPTETTTSTASTVPTPTETTTSSDTVSPSESPTTEVTPVESPTEHDSNGTDDGVTKTKSSRPDKGLAFTGVEDVVPIGILALGALTVGAGLMWLGGRRRDDA